MLVLCSHHITGIVCKIKNTMRIFENFLKNFIFRYTRDHDWCYAKNQIKKALKPSDYNYQEVLHFFRIFIVRGSAFTIRGQRVGEEGHDSAEHFFDHFAPKVDRKHRVDPTSHLGCHNGFYGSRIMLPKFLCLCGVPCRS